MDSLEAVFESFKLDDLDPTWTSQVYESNFSNIENVPVDYLLFLESYDVSELLKKTCSVVKDWIEKGQSEGENDRDGVSWETLLSLDLEIRPLLSVLAYLMKKGQAFDAGQHSRQSCLRATSLYFVLLAIPGSNAVEAFQPNLYELALKTLEWSQRLVGNEKNSKSPPGNSENDSDGSDNEEMISVLSKSQSFTLLRGLNAVMYDLLIMLKSGCTRMEIRLVEVTVYYLVEMTKLAEEPLNPRHKNEASTSSLAYNAYVALEQLCNPKLASLTAITKLIAKYSLPQFLVASANLPAKQMNIVRESSLYFFNNLLNCHPKEAVAALEILIQHTMIKCPERLDGRQKQATLVVKLLNVCSIDRNCLKRCVKDLIRLAHHNKICYRIFAQEIIGRYVMELSSKNHGEENFELFSQIEGILLATAICRCEDSSSMVRGRAIATLAELTDSIDKPLVRKIFEDDSSETSGEIAQLEQLEDALATEDLDSVLPGAKETIAMLKNRLEDERALVRRSALQVLRNAVLISPELLQTAIPIIRDHCRDSVLTVRRYAIRVLSNLFEEFPDTPRLCDDWVDSVIPRVFDSETKVQEEVLDSLKKLVITKMADEESDLPWRILSEIAINKMGDHLSRACAIWREGNLITERIISVIKSHVGTCNNVGAWLLLASISEHQKLKDLEHFFNLHGRALIDPENSDIFLASLSLRILKNSWSSFQDSALRKISRDLTKYLKDFQVNASLIRNCLDILLEVTEHLNSRTNENEETMVPSDICGELATLSESTITRIVENNEENTENLLFHAICTLGHATFFSWTEISMEIRRILQGFLLESLSECLAEEKQLYGAAIQVLGQQSLINRDIAVEMTPIFGRLLCNSKKRSNQLPSRNIFDENVEKYQNIASGSVVRVNAAKALADICVRFTALVEPYLSDMCVSMKDPNPEVRQVILVIFIQLLVEDTIMIKGSFFFHILTMLADDNSTIRQMTVFLIKERLISKNKNLITQQFVNGMYHFNDCEKPTSVANRRRKLRDKRILSVAGRANEEKRKIIYNFMLENLDPVGKLTVISKLTSQVLNPRGNNHLKLSCEKVVALIRDVLYVVASDHLQLNSGFRQVNDEDNLDEGNNSPTNSVIAEAMKKHRIQVFLPSLVELKGRCEAAKSPLAEDVTRFLIRTIADCNKEALTSLYNEYPKLEREIQRDSRKLNEQSREDREKESTPMKRPIVEKRPLILSSDLMPRIVLRRLSSLTYPQICGWSSGNIENSHEPSTSKISTTPKSSRNNSSR